MQSPRQQPANRAQSASVHEDDVLRSLRRIIRAVDLYSRRLLSQCGLSSPQLICLRQLAAHGPMPSGRLASQVNLSPATLSGIVDRLELRGLIKRTRQAEDKRRVVVELTPEGAELTGGAPSPLQDSFLQEFRALPAAQQEEISRVLRKLVSMMAAEDLDAAPLLTAGAVDDGTSAARKP
jgi:DNA-binding MarR family transcriptional regulator